MERWPCDFCGTEHVARPMWHGSGRESTWCRTLGVKAYSPEALMFRPARARVERDGPAASGLLRRTRVERLP